MTLDAGTRLGSYEVLSPLGAGGMGEVYRAKLPILKQQQTKRIRLQPVDRSFWALISKLWSRWQDALVIAEPDTVLRWRREGFRLIWRRRRRRAGRPSLAKAHQELIRWISTNSVLWGAPRIHGEARVLLPASFDVVKYHAVDWPSWSALTAHPMDRRS